ncbi:hypothetical protein QYF36_012834 [Acer negundo]|nr:hypothetical protein QYF36_012834 [Acer negundo]
MPISNHMQEENEKKRQKTIVVGEIETSFEIPDEYASGGCTELEKLRVPQCLLEQIKPDVKHDVQLKFIERLKDWKLHRRQRADGRFDTGLDGDKGVLKRSQTSSSSPSREKSEKHSTSGILEAEEKAVKEFLETAYNNMTNNHVNGGSKRRRYEDLSAISPDPVSNLNEEVPNKLDLLELSNNPDQDALAKSLANLIYDDLNLGDDNSN